MPATSRVPLRVELVDGGGSVDGDLIGPGFIVASTLAVLEQTTTPGAVGWVHGDTAANNGGYFRENTQWTKVLDLSPSGYDAGDITVSTSGFAGGRLEDAGNVQSLAAVLNGLTLGNTIAEVLAALATTDPAGSINAGRLPALPPLLGTLQHLLISGGRRVVGTDSPVLIGGTLQQNPGSASNITGITSWGPSTDKISGAVTGPVYVRLRIAKADFPTFPALSELSNYVLTARPSGDPNSPEASGAFAAITQIVVTDATYWYAYVRVNADYPVDPDVYLQIITPAEWRGRPAPGLVDPESLDAEAAATGEQIPQRASDTVWRWIGAPATWSRVGDTGAIPFAKLPHNSVRILADGSGTGITVATSNTTRRNTLTGFSPAFDLDTRANQSGIIEIEARLSITTRSANVGFGPGLEQTYSLEGFTFAQTLIASTAWSAGDDNGVLIESVDIYAGTVLLGTLSLYLAKDAANETGYYLTYDPDSSAPSTSNFALSNVVESAFVAQEGTSNTPTWTTLLDYNPSGGYALMRRQGNELPAGQDFSPALTAEHDDEILHIQFQISNGSSNAGRIWSMPLEIKCSDWRLGTPGSASGVDMSNVPIDASWTAGAFISDNEAGRPGDSPAGSDSWARVAIYKGFNGRIAFCLAAADTFIQRVRVRRHT